MGPYVDAQPPDGRYGAPAPTVAPGGAVTIYGHWYTSTCNDTGQTDPLEPLAPVHLTLTLPGDRIVRLGRFTPHGPDLGFRVTVRIPAGTEAGAATVEDGRGSRQPYQFQVGPSAVATSGGAR